MKTRLWFGLWLCWACSASAQGVLARDWTLAQVLDRVEQASFDVKSSQLALQAAQADRVAAGVTPSAVLGVNMVAINPSNLGQGTLWQRPIDTIVRLDQPIERGGKAQLRERAADAAWRASTHDVHEVIRQQKVTAAQAYWDLKLAQEQLRVAEANLALSQESSDAAGKRLKQGDLSRLDATRLAVEAQKAANERDQAMQQVVQVSLQLSQLLALPEMSDMRASDGWPVVPADWESRTQMVIDQRPDVQAAALRVEQAQAALDLAEAQRSTDVTVGVQFEHNPPNGGHLWGVGVSMPLGVDGRQAGPTAKARAALADAQVSLDRVKSAALAELTQQDSALGVALKRVNRTESLLLPQAKDAADAAAFARQQGALALQDVLDARRTWHTAQLDAASAHADVAKALAALSLFNEMVKP